MTQIGNVPEINAIKEHLNELKKINLIAEWEIPYENILTRPSALILFLTPTHESKLSEIWEELSVHEILQYQLNNEKKLSRLEWKVEFNTSKVHSNNI